MIVINFSPAFLKLTFYLCCSKSVDGWYMIKFAGDFWHFYKFFWCTESCQKQKSRQFLKTEFHCSQKTYFLIKTNVAGISCFKNNASFLQYRWKPVVCVFGINSPILLVRNSFHSGFIFLLDEICFLLLFSIDFVTCVFFLNLSYRNWFCISAKSVLKTTLNTNKTARIRTKPWMFRLPFKFYGAAVLT